MKNISDAQTFLTEVELKQVKDCITEAEKLTSGEIKVLICSASSILPRVTIADKEKAVIRRAKREFSRLGINKTKDSTGILILISVEERMVRVQPDEAIDDIMPQSTWQPLVNCVVEGIKGGFPARGLCNAVSQMGNFLSKHFPIKPGDVDELSNDVVIKGRW